MEKELEAATCAPSNSNESSWRQNEGVKVKVVVAK